MKKHNKIRIFLSTCLVALATVFCGVLMSAAPVKANAEESGTLASTEFQTNGASVRVFRKNVDGTLKETDKTGIRFHVEMGAGYTVNGTPLLDEATLNEKNGAFKMADGYKTYTLVLPKSMLGGKDLTVENVESLGAVQIDTTGFWYSDKDGNWESVAYIYDIPAEKRTQVFSFRGVICDPNGNVVAMTDVAERHVAFVAKKSYDDTIAGNHNWGSMVEVAKKELLELIPTYELIYNVNGTETSETVLWGETPKNVPTFEIDNVGHVEKSAAWFDTTGSETIDLTAAMQYGNDRTLTLTASSSAEFQFTGVADYNNFTPEDTAYNGVKVYATLPKADFYTEAEWTNGTSKMVEIDAKAVKVEYQGTGTFNGLQGVWTLLEGSGSGAQVRLVFAFDSSTMKNGDKITVKAGSIFYYNGLMYTLTEDYTIDYSVVNGEENYGMFLGYLTNKDIVEMRNWIEPTNTDRKTIRVTFKNDLFINSAFSFVYDGQLPAGYDYPVYTQTEAGVKTEIAGGQYYWNDGEHTILELYGHAYENNVTLHGAPGTKLVQNGGYFIFEEEMYAYYNGSYWAIASEAGTFDESSFVGKAYYHDKIEDGKEAKEIRFTTKANGTTADRWFDSVVQLKVENMSKTQPYAVYFTSVDGTVTGLEDFIYHGQATANGYNNIFAIKDVEGMQAGETITIIAGSRFWAGAEYYTASDDVVFYYTGTAWVVGDGTANETIGEENFSVKNYNYFESNRNNVRMHFTTEFFNGAFGALYVEKGSVKVNDTAYTNLYYHGGGNMIFEIRGDSTGEIGQNAFVDRLVIEAGTKLWIGVDDIASTEPSCVEFTEMIEWIFVGKTMRDSSGNLFGYHWVIPNNTDIGREDLARVYNETDVGGQVRLQFNSGITKDSYLGFVAMDTSKGVPVVNGVAMPEKAYCFAGDVANLFEIRGGEYGTKSGDYVKVPAGSVWWTTQGSFTFTEEIYAVYNGSSWVCGLNTEEELNGTFDMDNIQSVDNEGATEIRIRIPRGISDTYYGPMAVDGTVTLTKANGTTIATTYGYWYGGNSGTYTENHSLIGLQAPNFNGSENGDVLTIKAGAKFIVANNGYHKVPSDISYIYQNGTWAPATGWAIKVVFTNATVSMNNTAITSGETLSLFHGEHKITVTPNSGYAITSVTGATNNFDGTYTINATSNMTVTFNTQQSIKLGANAISSINQYDETQYGADLMGVRMNMNPDAFVSITAIEYGWLWNGSVTSTVAGGVYHSSVFSTPHNFFELRFDTTNLKVGDEFKIAKGTVSYGAGANAYAIEWTEDIIGVWTGYDWRLNYNPTKAGDLDWNAVGIESMYSYSDIVDGKTLNYTIRMNVKNALFGGATVSGGFAVGNVTINGTAYTGSWTYHGAPHNILQISNWNYAKGDKLVIAAGTKIYIGNSYYVTTNTLTATCQADGTGAQWNFTIS